jgi:penicillin-binding protein 1C
VLSTAPVFSEATIAEIVDILSDPVEGAAIFGARRTPETARRILKTGTANQFSNIWAIVASSRYVVGVWMGNVTGETVIGRPGSSTPAALAGEVLDALTRRD